MTEPQNDVTSNEISRTVDDNRDEILQFLTEYIRRQSVNVQKLVEGDDPEGLLKTQRWMRDWLSTSGFDDVDYWEPSHNRANVVGYVRGTRTGEKPALMLLGHSDVVPVTEVQRRQWSTTNGDPWSGRLENGRVYGRGSSDMKSGNTAFLWALRLLKELGIRLQRDVIAGLVCGEESSSKEDGVLSLIDRGHVPEFAVVAEPTDLIICPASMGLFFVKIGVTGRSAHISSSYETKYKSRPGEPLAVDAVAKALQMNRAMQDLDARWSREFFHPLAPPLSMSITLTAIHGGVERAEISEFAELVYVVQYNPDLNGETIIEAVKKQISAATESDEWLRENPPVVTVPYMQPNLPPLNLDQKNENVGRLVTSYNGVMSGRGQVGLFPAPCDANFLFEKGIPTLIFGPGSLAMNVHGANEYVPAQQVIDSCKIIATFVAATCGVA